MFDKKKKKKNSLESRKKATVVDRSKKKKVVPKLYKGSDDGTVPRSAYLDEKMKRIKAEKRAERRGSGSSSDLSDSDLSEMLAEINSSSESSSSDSDSDSSSSSDSESDPHNQAVRSLENKIQKLKTKQKEKIKEKNMKLITEKQKLENKKWKQKDLFVDQELYTRHKATRREMLAVGGAGNWISHLFKEVNAGRRVEGNLVWRMVQKFAVVMFVKDINKEVGKCSEIIEATRAKHNIDEDQILEVVLDDSHAGKVTYLDLQKLSSKRTLPQIFVNETYIGGLEELKDMAAKGLLLRQILIFQGIVDSKCEKCVNLARHVKQVNI